MHRFRLVWESGFPRRPGGRFSELMNVTRVLIVGENAHRASGLLRRLDSWACLVSFAESCAKALPLLKRHQFDFVLSQLMLSDGSADQFLRPLQGARTHVLFSHLLEDDCLWLHVLDRGQNRWWKPMLLRPEEFLILLERHIQRQYKGTLNPNGNVRDPDDDSSLVTA